MRKYEDCLPIIDNEIYKRKNKTNLYLNDADFEDIAQIIRIHIFNQWYLFDDTKPLEHWVNKIITHQISNFIRNNYTSIAPPCYKCPANQGGGLCSFTTSGEQCSECPLFKKWTKAKQDGFNIKFATSLQSEDGDNQTVEDKIAIQSTNIDWTAAMSKLSDQLKSRLSKELYLVYKFIYLDGNSDIDLAKKLKFKTSEKNRVPGYKQIYNFKQKIIEEAKKILLEEDIL